MRTRVVAHLSLDIHYILAEGASGIITYVVGGDIIVGPPPGSTQGPAEDNLQIGNDTK